ncbi:MAG: hypothetical protein H7318_08035 [Oligoflexus sp.]|nr:hypothetical protein [Oligoflexus sp.]
MLEYLYEEMTELSLTASGRRVLRDAPEPIQAKLIRAINALGKDDQQALDRLLKLMLGGVSGLDPTPSLFFED